MMAIVSASEKFQALPKSVSMEYKEQRDLFNLNAVLQELKWPLLMTKILKMLIDMLKNPDMDIDCGFKNA